MATTARNPIVKKRKAAASIVWFEIPPDDIARAKSVYNSLFGWKFNKFPAAVPEYWHIDTGGHDKTPDGGLMARMHPQQPITNYVSVPSVAHAMTKVETLGGKVCKSKTAVQGMGYFAICADTEDNPFALWEMNAGAK